MSCCLLSAAVRKAPNAALLAKKKADVLVPPKKNNAISMTTEAEREMAGPSWVQEKQRYLSMSLQDKRKEYKCGENYHELDNVKTWVDLVLDDGGSNLPPKMAALYDFRLDSTMNRELAEKVSLFRGDITTLEVDAIVNAANKSLLGGGGVDGAIHSAAGPYLRAENKTHGGCQVGEVKISGGYKLPAKYVISTVGPQGERPDLLRSCYLNAMDLTVQKKLTSIAFPCISTGVYGYPLVAASHIAISTVRKHLEEHGDSIERVIFCLFMQNDEEVYHRLMQSYFPLK